jgi:hypothetical protein
VDPRLRRRQHARATANVLGALALAGCTSILGIDGDFQRSTGAGGSGSGGAGAGGEDACSCATGPDLQGYAELVLAVREIDFGNDTNDWMDLGFDLDGMNGDETGHCGSNIEDQDGNDQIDNMFGAIAPSIVASRLGAGFKFNEAVNETFSSGHATMLLRFVDLSSATSQSDLGTEVLAGADLGAPPDFGDDITWTVDPSSKSGDAARASFTSGSVCCSQWTSGTAEGELLLYLRLREDVPLVLTIRAARMTLDLTPDENGDYHGMFGGTLRLSELLGEIRRIDQDFTCLGADAKKLRERADMLYTGEQDQSSLCDGLSVGFAVTMHPVSLGGDGDAHPAPAAACIDGPGVK